MIRSLWTAASGMKAQQLNVDTISNNLANVNTTGFKKSRASFQDLMYQTIKQPGTPNSQGSQIPTGIQVGHGVRAAATQKIFTQGSLKNTGNSLDLAIQGDGFFKVRLPDGSIGYTRDGSFNLDSMGQLVTSDGYKLQPPINIPADATNVTINEEGMVTYMTPGADVPQEGGQIELANFANPAGLKAIGQNIYKQTAASGGAMDGVPGQAGYGTLAQGFLESSNVKVVDEMVDMIAAQRAYEVNSKAIKTSNDMLKQANNLKR
ncbi:flagellar basal-body rod protein FlgG [Halobacteroides halobius DSM 5150]|uniref:Flagellar basal-body rod protein FlgG n=1 Tax=Halobacteroides halobius (strain ATCC 35273 / DSM 5150 / MD-1) TaxID=748449 RepID=L0KD93_HALHC|nr:flagellar basal-body rod protein FlgG [Halobacteroides halobius]AGB42324.1 flagellar basal-body rod protein FlgG [Halobacteroides halobius DSM 5150]